MDKLVVTVDEAGEMLAGLSRSAVYELLRSRQLDSVKIGGRRGIPMDSLRAYIERLRLVDTDPATWTRKAS